MCTCGLLQDVEENRDLGITSWGRGQQSIQREDQEALLRAPGRPDPKMGFII